MRLDTLRKQVEELAEKHKPPFKLVWLEWDEEAPDSEESTVFLKWGPPQSTQGVIR